MKDKTKENRLRNWYAFSAFLFLALCTMLTGIVSGCGSGTGEVSLEEMLAQGQESTKEDGNGLTEAEVQVDKQAESALQATVWVHICGEVQRPGIYELPEGSMVYDGVARAGGFTEKADTTYYNLAATVSGGMKIEIPSKQNSGENSSAETATSGDGHGDTGLVNINTATSEVLQTLPGIGASRAADIIAYREKNGGFGDTADIMKVSGIKEATYEKIKDYITVE